LANRVQLGRKRGEQGGEPDSGNERPHSLASEASQRQGGPIGFGTVDVHQGVPFVSGGMTSWQLGGTP
jgi:hypothetical protein